MALRACKAQLQYQYITILNVCVVVGVSVCVCVCVCVCNGSGKFSGGRTIVVIATFVLTKLCTNIPIPIIIPQPP